MLEPKEYGTDVATVSGGNKRMKQGQQQRDSVKVLFCFALYVVNLCTLNPQVHAEVLHRAMQVPKSHTGHCSRAALPEQGPAPFAPDSKQAPMPLCCELRDGTNRVIPVSPVQTHIPFLLHFLLPLTDADIFINNKQVAPIFQASHASRPPPVSLFTVVLLI